MFYGIHYTANTFVATLIASSAHNAFAMNGYSELVDENS